MEKTRSFLVLIATIGTIIFNWLAAAGYINGVTPDQISDKYQTVVTPAGYAFTIWSLIYLGISAFSVYQLLPSNIDRYRSVRSWFIFSCLLNCGWIFFWHNDLIAVCLGLIVALAIVLGVITYRIKNAESPLSALMTKAPFGIYLGWVTAASLVNLAVFLVHSGFNLGDALIPFGAVLLLVAAALGVFFRIKLLNFTAPAAVAWALTAIAVKQSGKTLIVAAAAAGVIACLIASLSFVLNLKTANYEQR